MTSVKSSDFDSGVLAFDCALGGCVVGVRASASSPIVEKTLLTDREQAAKLVPMIQDVMAEAGVDFEGLGLIVTGVGPGSFTGLRIALSAARALGLARGLPVQGVETMAAMRDSCRTDGDTRPSLIVLDAKRADFYVAAYDVDGQEVIAPCCMMTEDIFALKERGDFILCGDAIPKLRRIAEEKNVSFFEDVRERAVLSASALLERGVVRFLEGGRRAEKPQPLYLRGADVSLSQKPQRSIAAEENLKK